MTNELQEQIKKEIEVNENHINNFPLETETGTKKMKEKFHRNAVKERNAYIEKELTKFQEYQRNTYQVLDNYVQSNKPEDKNNQYNEEQQKLEELLKILPLTNDKISLEMKLGYAHIFYELSEEASASLKVINSCILDFTEKMKSAQIKFL